MRTRGREKSKNVVNRRGEARSGGGSGLIFGLLQMIISRFGIGGIVFLVIGFFALQAIGVNPLSLLAAGQQSATTQTTGSKVDLCEEGDETDQFMCVVLASTENVWTQEFKKRGAQYEEPKMNIFSGGVQAGQCGYATSAVGPFYCPATREVYLDTAFFKELAGRFGAAGDFAQAYVVAHEVGHHIQTITGISEKVQRAKQGASKKEQNALQVRMELQADCYAGVWAHFENARFGGIEPGDIDEALRAANAIGDDTLQRQAGQKPMPDSFTHGTSAQRMRWFKRGYELGSVEECDTFKSDI